MSPAEIIEEGNITHAEVKSEYVLQTNRGIITSTGCRNDITWWVLPGMNGIVIERAFAQN